jgi:hypothetical protein
MKKAILNILIIFLIFTSVKAQKANSLLANNIAIECYKNTAKYNKSLYKKSFRLDSIKVDITRFKTTIKAVSLFEKSKRTLEITYCFNNEAIKAIYVREPSLQFPEYAAANYQIYFNNGELIYKILRFSTTGPLIGLNYPVDKDMCEVFGYIKAVDDVFILNYSKQLFRKILASEKE